MHLISLFSNNQLKKIMTLSNLKIIVSSTAPLFCFVLHWLGQCSTLPIHRRLRVLYCQLLLQFTGQGNEYILYLVTLLRRTLHISQVLLGTKLFHLILGHLSLILKIRLIPYQKENSILFGISLDLVHPKLADIFKAKRVSEVKHEKDALTAPVICTCNGPESFLSGRVPNLKLDIFVINLNGLEPEIDSDCCKVVLRELIFYEPD